MTLVLSGTNGISDDGKNPSIQFDTAGRVRLPNMPFCFVVKTNGAGWDTVSSANYLYHNDIRQNVGNCYNSSSGVFVCPVPGRYRIDFSYLGGQGTTGWVNAYATKNGSYITGNFHTNTNGNSYWPCTAGWATTYCQANDTLSMMVTSGAGAIYTLDGYTQMMISMIL